MTSIKGYKPCHTQIDIASAGYRGYRRFGGWDAKREALVPIQYMQLVHAQRSTAFASMPYALDSIALAVEAGVIDRDTFVAQAFATREDFDAFCRGLEDAEDVWVNDRHFRAFFEMFSSEESLTTYPSIGETLQREYAAVAVA